jgi:LemA protein
LVAISILIGVAVLIGIAVVLYNGLARAGLRAREAWSGIDVQLRRRASLVPNLVEAVQAYAAHERGTFEAVTRARGSLERARGAAESAQANRELEQALGRLLALAEAYPELRASESFAHLQAELSDTEDKIAYARQFYNRNVLAYNERIAVLPDLLIARAFAFEPLEFFATGEDGRAEVRLGMAPPEAAAAPPRG